MANAILKQKVANNAKADKQLLEHRERAKQNNESEIRLRIARIAAGAAVRWQRTVAQRSRNGGEIDVNVTGKPLYLTRPE